MGSGYICDSRCIEAGFVDTQVGIGTAYFDAVYYRMEADFVGRPVRKGGSVCWSTRGGGGTGMTNHQDGRRPGSSATRMKRVHELGDREMRHRLDFLFSK